jgi:hypothetical protein
MGQTERFLWHGALMAAAMWIGMGVYVLVLIAVGYGDLSNRNPYIWAISMCPTPGPARRSGVWAGSSAGSRCCPSLLYGHEKGHFPLGVVDFDLGRGGRI